MTRVNCEGWWEQEGFGRQPMEQLVLQFTGDKLTGSGIDIIGPFRLDGAFDQLGVSILKQYLGQHQIRYVGTSDGEGTLHGYWTSHGILGGNWLIRIQSAQGAQSQQVSDITEQLRGK